jgi:hypothetical protein
MIPIGREVTLLLCWKQCDEIWFFKHGNYVRRFAYTLLIGGMSINPSDVNLSGFAPKNGTSSRP